MSALVEVLVPGLLTTVQDLGRWGYQAIGVPVAGPMDPFAHRRANALVGNPRDFATLETTIVGPALRFHDARVIAVAGADFELFLDDQAVASEVALKVRPDSILRFGVRRRGARAYLAVAGGVDAPFTLGSRATHVATATGGWRGRALLAGDRLPLGAGRDAGPAHRAAHREEPVASASGPIVLRVLPGPQADRFSDDALNALVSAPYTADANSNRMGYRLSGPPLRHRTTADIISDATPLGTLQVPASGQPLLLMADRPTTGGYAKLATVISADVGLAGQVAPGDRLAFRVCDRAEALSALLKRERPLLALESEVW